MHGFKLAPKMLYKKTRVIMFTTLCWVTLCLLLHFKAYLLVLSRVSWILSSIFHAAGKLKGMRIKRYLLSCETPNFTSGFYRKKMRAEFLQNIFKGCWQFVSYFWIDFLKAILESNILFSLKSQQKFLRAAITKEMTEQDTAWYLNYLHHNQIFKKCKFILV